MTRMHQARFPHAVLPLALVLPQLALLALFVYWPAGETIRAAIGTGAGGAPGGRIGLETFAALFVSADYLESAWFTAWFSLAAAIPALGLALVLALKADAVLRGAATYRVLLVWVYTVAPPAAGVIAVLIADLHLGALVEAARAAGFEIALGDGAGTLAALVAVTAWKLVPVDFACLLAALHMVPRALRDAAAIDCHSRWRRFTAITWPLIAPACGLVLVVNLALCVFDTVAVFDVMAASGPAVMPAPLAYKAYTDGLAGADAGLVAAQSLMLVAVAGALFTAVLLVAARLRPRFGAG